MADWELDPACFHLGQRPMCVVHVSYYRDHNTRIRAESALRQARLWFPEPPPKATPQFMDTSFVFSPYIPV